VDSEQGSRPGMCTIKEIMKIYAFLGIIMPVGRRTTFGNV
jgi:hypothetical protein